ncbi:MAG: macro domain-containing protein [Alcanivoracaceae bacterium]|nr:macro domain-containing protein [Alcanivoracaceae bacterium]
MIEYKRGNLLVEDAQAIVNTVNCVGVMGRGIALQFKKAYPDNFKAYALACKNNEVVAGKMFTFFTGQLANPKYIINFPTKRHWRGKSRIEDIESGLASLIDIIKKNEIKSIAIPPLGSGLGGLDWMVVKQLIEKYFQSVNDVRVIVFEPVGAPQSKNMAATRHPPQMTVGRATLVVLMNRYLQGLLDPFITLLELHKLMYFMQEAGEPLKLKYKKAIFGPYAENLRHVLNVIEGHFITGYADGGDNPSKQLELLPSAIGNARTFLKEHNHANERSKKVAQLVDGFESPYGLELLATVHWIIKKEPVDTFEKLINKIYEWSSHKNKFTVRQIQIAVDVLSQKGWIQKPFK